jgi:opacity protein-like surface antigen
VKKVLGSIAAGVLMFAAASACAQSTDLPVVYAGIALGGSKAEGFCAGVSGPGVTCDDTGAALKVFGGYQFHRHFAVEMSTGLVEALGLAVLPIGESVAFYGKAGVYRASTEARANTIAVVGDFEESNTDFTAGFGVRIDITRKFGVRAEWQRYFDVGGGNIGVSDIDVFSVGVQLKF